MILYHGSDQIINEPKYNYGKPYNDYGLGFYLTEDKEIAELWASKNSSGGYLLKYDLNIKDLKVLSLVGTKKEDILKWITILVRHRFRETELQRYKTTIDLLRKYYDVNIDDYDVIIGYRADDSYFKYSRDFVANDLSLESLADAMKLGRLGTQIVIKSEKAFKNIKLLSYEKIETSDKYLNIQNEASRNYRKLKQDDSINNTFIRDILRGINNEN